MKFYEKLLLGTAGTAGAGIAAWKTMFPWIGYDLQLINVGRKIMSKRDQALTSLLIDKFEEHVRNQPKKPFIIFEDCVYTYEYVDQMACKVANMAKSWGLKALDVAAIMIQNEPAFVWTFIGLQKLGVSVAFINYHLKMGPLVHSVLAAKPKVLIVGAGEALLEAVTEVRDDLGSIDVYVQGLGSRPAPIGIISFDPLFQEAHSAAVSPKVRSEVAMTDICCFIYTSGTTGNPKPAFITQMKAVGISCALLTVDLRPSDYVYIVLPLYHSSGGGIGLFGVLIEGNPKPVIIQHRKACDVTAATEGTLSLQSSDTIYVVLPLYHSAGLGIGLGSCMGTGATIVLRNRFSARHFWEDCCRYDVTVIQYIGELFRYLLAQPPSKFDSSHKVRAAFGNGLRKDIWLDVEKRYKIPQVVEFFGATEGTTLLLNVANKPGAIGRLSPFLNKLDPDPKALVKFDFSTAMPVRDKNGRCIKVEIGEPGLFLSKVPDLLIENGKFEVYQSSKEANEKKLVRDAFAPGDLYFNYGDVFVLDKDYFLYFSDRIGDTFRWKGENVSTTELANVITTLNFVNDANVYGVTIPANDGRAGMVALTLNDGCDIGDKELKELFDLVEKLPSYAQPLFLRILDKAIITGTFKQRKVELVKEGYDLNLVKDPLFYLNREKGTYSLLSAPDLSKFLSSKL